MLPNLRRGFLSALVNTVDTLSFPRLMIIAGTQLSLAIADPVGSSVLKPDLLVRITRFPAVSADMVQSTIGRVLDISGCTMSPEAQNLLSGRNRCLSVVNMLIQIREHGSGKSKQQLFSDAVAATIEDLNGQIKRTVQILLESDPHGGVYSFSLLLFDKLLTFE